MTDRKQAQLVRVDTRSIWVQQEEAITALLSAPTAAAAAAKVGMSESLLLAWLKDPAFDTKYRTARRAVVDGGVVQLQQSVGKAAEALTRNLTCGIPGVEVEAARVILEHATHGLERTESVEPPHPRRRGPT
jgi:hypothetical protein